jgi:trans-aconitate 2-methyltransferase
MSTDAWDPVQYERFKAERTAPFEDLLSLVSPVPGGTAVDLGCGTGELTAVLHTRLRAAETTGIDSSASMLERAAELADPAPGLRFEQGDLAAFSGEVDVVFANAALQWVPDHDELLARLTRCLRPGGQLAVQVPANHDHPSHVLAAEMAAELGLDDGGFRTVLAPEAYATILDALGYAGQHVRLQVYGHRMPSTAGVVEWVKGTRLTDIRRQLGDDAAYDDFLERYTARLLELLGDPDATRPYFYAFKRILFWGRRAAA